MTKKDRTSLVITLAVVAIGALVALAGSQGGATIGSLPAFALAVAAAFIIQWVVYIHAWAKRTEKYFDLTGSLTYISITVLLVILTPGLDPRAYVLAALVVIWAARLGSFLFRRISKAGKDDRFDELKSSFFRFLNVWTIQGLWVTFTAAAAWVGITSSQRVAFDWLAIIGLVVWAIGFAFEVVADAQKSRFKADPANEGRFISTGLWAKSRHPNYFGEIVLWIGVALIALPTFQGWQWVAIISPLFVTLLLTRVSGVPMLEKKADSKWGGQEDYEEYKRSTPVLIPKP
jgi:steroid 5-alpha reductase family enzyme